LPKRHGRDCGSRVHEHADAPHQLGLPRSHSNRPADRCTTDKGDNCSTPHAHRGVCKRRSQAFAQIRRSPLRVQKPPLRPRAATSVIPPGSGNNSDIAACPFRATTVIPTAQILACRRTGRSERDAQARLRQPPCNGVLATVSLSKPSSIKKFRPLGNDIALAMSSQQTSKNSPDSFPRITAPGSPRISRQSSRPTSALGRRRRACRTKYVEGARLPFRVIFGSRRSHPRGPFCPQERTSSA
jgi:hypothetical protein